MISEIEIKNFRSIEYLNLELSSLSALIGPNSSGKTNILKAINLVLGEGWTTKAKVARELFRNPADPIEIKLELDPPISFTNSRGYEVVISSVELSMTLIPELQAKTTINDGQTFYDQELFKKLCHFIYIPSERNLSDELRVSGWTMLGKMMKKVYENYVEYYGNDERRLQNDFKQKMQEPKQFLEADFDADINFSKFAEVFVKNCKDNSAGLANSFDPRLEIYNLNWFYKTLQIHVQEAGNQSDFDCEEVGAGMKNLLMISIFQTYSTLMGGKVIFGFEEPEIYLYPNAQRFLYSNMQQISEKSQILYTTHNPNFVDAARPDDLFLVRKNEGSGTYILDKQTQITTQVARENWDRIYTQFNSERNEIFFAKKVILVEGPSDKVFISVMAKDRWNIDLDSKGITIVNCGGKSGVNFFVGVCLISGVDDFFAIWDSDDENYSPQRNCLPEAENLGKAIQIEGNLERLIGISSSSDRKIRNAYDWIKNPGNSVPEIFLPLKDFLADSQPVNDAGSRSDANPVDQPF